jgi:NADPH2:quinone reductase
MTAVPYEKHAPKAHNPSAKMRSVMKAIVATRFGEPDVLAVRDVPVPQPGENEVLVKVEAAGVNFADVLSVQGKYAGGPKPPFTPGREFAGTLAETGERVMGYSEHGAFAEYIAAQRHRLWPAPAQFTAVQAAAFPVNFLTAYFAYWEAGLVQRDHDYQVRFAGGRRPRVLIHAVAGGVGTAAVQIGKLLGVEMYGTASSDAKLQGAYDLGLDHRINYARQDYLQLIKEHTKGEGVDAVFEMLGGEETARSIRSMGFLGRCILYGSVSGKPPQFDARELYSKAQSVWGLWLSRLAGRPELLNDALGQLNGWAAEGKLKPVVGNVLPLDQVAQAFALLSDRKNFGKIVLKVE